ncbi:MAG TPA: hypothetical protein DDZ51_20435, partial [Planctomycetaceae bacterium]|nr:hypothetical protein [Planctomycetaceae bacterium]
MVNQIAASNAAVLLKASYLGFFSIATVGMLNGPPFAGRASLLLPAANSQTEQTSAVEPGDSSPLYERQFLESHPDAPSVHASTITQLRDGRMMAAWFGGSREGGKDVSIYGAFWNVQTETWDTPSVIVDAQSAGRELGRYIKKVGNPVLYCDRSGRVWLYYVTVSLGG